MAAVRTAGTPVDAGHGRTRRRARDWAEIQERMLVPLYEAVYDRLDVGPADAVLEFGCRAGLSLLLAAARGAEVAGVEGEEELRALAHQRRLPVRERLAHPVGAGHPGCPGPATHSLVTAFDHLACAPDPRALVREAALLVVPGGHLALATWGPPGRCDTAGVLEPAVRLAPPEPAAPPCRPFLLSGPGLLETLVAGAGLSLAGSGAVRCPFAYPDMDSAVRGLLSTGLFDAAARFSGEAQVRKELREALHTRLRPDGTVRMENVFRYVLGRVRRHRPAPA